jgi:rhamnogalacturonyl hydrolase YesR
MILLFLGNPLRGDGPVAVDDQARTVQNTPISIAVLANDSDAGSNQMAILRVTAPAHGRVTISSNAVPPNPDLTRLFQFAGTQLSNSVFQVGGLDLTGTNRYPRGTAPDGTWLCRSANNWISGFFPGSLWQMFEETGDARYQDWAVAWMGGVSSNQYVTTTDDVGFEINCSFGTGYRLTGDPAYRAVLLQAAHSMTNCYNAAAGCVGLPGDSTPPTFDGWIDTMMNVELLFRAYTLGGDTNLYSIARSHAEKTMLNNVRADGSTYQIVHYDPVTGAVLSRGNLGGGPLDETTWARGHSWGIYGFTMAYRETGDPRFLDTAQRLADYYLTNVPPDYVPYWDYQAPNIPDEPRDSSAAAAAFSGLLELSQRVTNSVDAARYWQGARRIFESLSSTNYLAQGTTSSGILLHGTGESPYDTMLESNVCLIYGDYYFIEGLQRYKAIYSQTAVTYVPNTNFCGTDSFTYQVCDSGGNCATAMVTVVVSPAATNMLATQISLAPATRLPTITFPTSTGQFYHVQYRDVLAAGAWSILATNLAGSGAALSVTDTNPAARRFYRVGAWLP